MGEVKISCIIPLCDRTDYLNSAIDSVLAQTVKPHEIIVINNGIKELSLEPEYSQVVTVHNMLPYAGVAQALNFGASLASGNYLAFLEDDDMWNNQYLENVIAEIEKGAEYLVSRVDKLENGEITQYKSAEGKLNLDVLLERNPGTNNSNTVIAKELFYRVGGFDPKLAVSADRSLAIEVLRIGAKTRVLDWNQEIVRFHAGPRLSKNTHKLLESYLQFLWKYYAIMTWRQRFAHGKKLLHAAKCSCTQ